MMCRLVIISIKNFSKSVCLSRTFVVRIQRRHQIELNNRVLFEFFSASIFLNAFNQWDRTTYYYYLYSITVRNGSKSENDVTGRITVLLEDGTKCNVFIITIQ